MAFDSGYPGLRGMDTPNQYPKPYLNRIDFGSHDEVVFVQAANLMGVEKHDAETPAIMDIGMMVFRLGKYTDLHCKRLRLHKVFEGECAADFGGGFNQIPVFNLAHQGIGFTHR